MITRNRPSLSCLPCKRRKIKCEKQRPRCRYCERLNDTCVYEPYVPNNDAKDQKRKRRPLREQNISEDSRIKEARPMASARQQQDPTPTIEERPRSSTITRQSQEQTESSNVPSPSLQTERYTASGLDSALLMSDSDFGLLEDAEHTLVGGSKPDSDRTSAYPDFSSGSDDFTLDPVFSPGSTPIENWVLLDPDTQDHDLTPLVKQLSEKNGGL